MVTSEIIKPTETIYGIESGPPKIADVAKISGPYSDYWPQFAAMSGVDVRRVGEANGCKLGALTNRLFNGQTIRTGLEFVDRLSPAKVAEEWYLGLGSFNRLHGASPGLLLAASLLWENPTNSGQDDARSNRFINELSGMRPGQIPDRMKQALSSDDQLSHISLAGHILLDIDRIPGDNTIDVRKYAAGLSSKLNSGLIELLLAQPKLTDIQSRVLSDALKANYDAQFDGISLKQSNGELLGADYEEKCTALLGKYVGSILNAKDKIASGDLLEHYFIALMRFALNTWQGKNRYEVRMATRRQDAPNDKFAWEHIPKFSIDAFVSDSTGMEATRFVQLKMTQEPELNDYADGIIVLDGILTQDIPNRQKTVEMETGLRQMLGLIQEVKSGYTYKGREDVISRHVLTVRQKLGL